MILKVARIVILKMVIVIGVLVVMRLSRVALLFFISIATLCFMQLQCCCSFSSHRVALTHAPLCSGIGQADQGTS